MKWSNKGHELDEYGKELVNNYQIRGAKIYIFGAGLIGEEIRPVFERYGCFSGYIDNDKNPLTLSEAFIMPDYNCYTTMKRIGFSDKDKLSDVIEKFTNYNRSSNMLITGVPGIGKTSITAWIANEYADDDNVVILRFRDWEREELEKGLIKSICKTLACKKQDLENMVLILDGFDEIKSIGSCDSFLNDFFNDILDFDSLKIIITSRPNYIDSNNFKYVYELLPFNISEIQKFYQLIKGSKIKGNKIANNNLDVLGIPVILYMAIMSNIDFTQEATKPELYNRIFREKGGIFDKFSYIGSGYDYGSHLLRDKNNIKKYLTFLQEVSFIMFENNSLILYKEAYQIPTLNFHGYNVNILDFPIKYLLENSGTGIEFIHKSIYEYFVSEYIFGLINDTINTNPKDILPNVLGKLFKKRTLSLEILDFLKFKIANSNLNSKFDIINQAFQEMLEHGMTYYTNKCFENVIECEMNVFTNMLELLHLWDDCRFDVNNSMCLFLKYNIKKGLNLKNVNIENKDLSGVNLANANLSGANLSYCIFKGANLNEVNIDGATLTNIDLRNANLSKMNFKSAIFENVILENAIIDETLFSEEQILYLEKYYNIQEDIVTTTALFRTLNSIRINNNVFNLNGTDKVVFNQSNIDKLIMALNKEK